MPAKTLTLTALMAATLLANTSTLVADDEVVSATKYESPKRGGCRLKFSSLHVDQDLFLEYTPLLTNQNEDRAYTMGFMMSFRSCKNTRNPLISYTLQERVLGLFGLGEVENKNYITSFGAMAFTPDDLRDPNPIFDDIPYSSLFYMSNSVIVSNTSYNSAAEVSLNFGLMGLPLGGWVQSGIHSLNRKLSNSDEPYDPKGWDNQISSGGEPTAMVKIAWYKRAPIKSSHIDVVYSADASLGYYTGVGAGVVVKIGKIDTQTPVWRVGKLGNYQSTASKLKVEGKALKPEFYFLTAHHATLRGYNGLLQGQFRSNVHQLSGHEIRGLLFENTVGVGFTIGSKAEHDILYSCTRQTAEHRLSTKRSHHWCGVNYSKAF